MPDLDPGSARCTSMVLIVFRVISVERLLSRISFGRVLAEPPDRGEDGEGGDRDQDGVAGEGEPDQVSVRLVGDPFAEMMLREPANLLRLRDVWQLRVHGHRVELGAARTGEPRLRDVAAAGVLGVDVVDP